MDEELLAMAGVRKSFRGRAVLVDIGFNVARGESVALLGRNGSGKSTTLRIAAGLLAPDAGTVRLAGRPWGPGRKPAVRVGYCPQENVLYPDLSVEENLLFSARLNGLPRQACTQTVPWALDRLGLSDLSRQRAGQLSGGQQRRLTLASAAVHRPDLLLVEEPEAGVDADSRSRLKSFLRELAEESALLWTSHDPDLVAKAASRAVRLELGVVVADGSPAKVAKMATTPLLLEFTATAPSRGVAA